MARLWSPNDYYCDNTTMTFDWTTSGSAVSYQLTTIAEPAPKTIRDWLDEQIGAVLAIGRQEVIA